MVAFVWQFVARDDRISEFEHAYSSIGAWAELFSKAPGFRGTTLLRDTENSRRFLTMDRWDSVEAQSAMREKFAREYEELDRACEHLTESERRIGIFEEPGPIVRKSA
jgi:heme-degrading monooxygenase HmoA